MTAERELGRGMGSCIKQRVRLMRELRGQMTLKSTLGTIFILQFILKSKLKLQDHKPMFGFGQVEKRSDLGKFRHFCANVRRMRM